MSEKVALIAMGACASAHHWSRELHKRGCQVQLIAAQFVKPYVKSNKNDRVDAEAICETGNSAATTAHGYQAPAGKTL